MHLHHATLFIRDAERSLRFYRDGLGLAVLIDREFDGDWPTLLGVAPDSTRLRAIVLGDPENPQIAQVELVTFADGVPDGPPPGEPATGTVLLSFQVDLASVLPALEAAASTAPQQITLKRGNAVASVRDPDGILVELIDIGPADSRP